MTDDDTPIQVQTLPSEQLTVVHKQSTAVILIDFRTGVTDTLSLTITQAMKLQKLLTMSGDPIPTYRGKKEFFLATDSLDTPDATPYPVVSGGENSVRIRGTNGTQVQLKSPDITAFSECLSTWGILLTSESDIDNPVVQRSILSLPAMIQLEDGITEPLLHAKHDEVLEHYHRPVGYWSPEQGEYVTKH